MSCWSVNVKGKPEVAGYRSSTVAVGVKGKIYIFDAYDIGTNFTSIGPLDVQVFRTDTYQWSVLKNQNVTLINELLPRLLLWRTAVVYNDLVYLFADINRQSWNVLLCYDTNSHLWSKPSVTGIMPPASAHFSGHSTCVVNDAIYVFGGFDGDLGLYSQDIHKLDLKSLNWSHVHTTGQPPKHRIGFSATAIKNCMFIYGGSGDEGYYEDVIHLDTQTMTWTTHEVIGYRPGGRVFHSAVCYKDSLLVFGGFNRDNEETYNGFVRYDPDSRCWSQVETKGNGPCARHHHSCVLIHDRAFLFGGFPYPWPVSPRQPDHLNNIHACDFAPSLKTLSTVAVLEHKLDQKGLPETIRSYIKLTNAKEILSENNDV